MRPAENELGLFFIYKYLKFISSHNIDIFLKQMATKYFKLKKKKTWLIYFLVIS